jgi:hypothetical protein
MFYEIRYFRLVQIYGKVILLATLSMIAYNYEIYKQDYPEGILILQVH